MDLPLGGSHLAGRASFKKREERIFGFRGIDKKEKQKEKYPLETQILLINVQRCGSVEYASKVYVDFCLFIGFGIIMIR